MKVLKNKSTLAALATLSLSLAGCGSGSGSGGGNTPNTNLNAQQLAAQQLARNNQNNPLSFDIVQGRIINRELRLIDGRVSSEVLKMSCMKDFAKKSIPTMGMKQNMDMKLTFDANGILVVSIKDFGGIKRSGAITPAAGVASPTGTVNSNTGLQGTPVPLNNSAAQNGQSMATQNFAKMTPSGATYTLADGQNIKIGGFDAFGTLSAEYINAVLSAGGVYDHDAKEARRESVSANEVSSQSTARSSSGFDPNYQLGQSLFPVTAPVNYVLNQTQSVTMDGSYAKAHFDGFEAAVLVTEQINRQHVSRIDAHGVYEKLEAFTKDPNSSINCVNEYENHIEAMYFQ